jgi:hypothetical protein
MSTRAYYGKFLDRLDGRFLDARPRPKFRLKARFRFRDPNGLLWSVPGRTVVDGASIPQAFWSFIGGPFEGPYLNASVVHDHYCDTKSRTDRDTHRNFYYGMRTSGVETWKANFMYWAVAAFGPRWTLTRRVVPKLVSRRVGTKKLAFIQVAEVKDMLATLPEVDLGDPETLAAVLGKASAVARSLKTTGGDVLDISASGQVACDLDAIAESADHYRSVFSDKGFLLAPEQLGVLAHWDAAGLDQVRPWENNRLPAYRDAAVLGPRSLRAIGIGRHFRLGPHSAAVLGDQIDTRSLRMSVVHPV